MSCNTIIINEYQSPCGVLVLGSYGNLLCMCDWEIEKHHIRIRKRLANTLDTTFREGRTPVIEQAALQLDEFFERKRTHFNIPLLFAGTDFQKTVWSELLKIPYGCTASYGTLAKAIGMPGAIRAVANANGANAISIFVPCHRIIGTDGSLTGYGGGIDAKKHLLNLENTSFHTH